MKMTSKALQSGVDVLFEEPKPFLAELRKHHPSSDILRCSSVIEYYKNAFVVCAPFDMTISARRMGVDIEVSIKELDQTAFEDSVVLRKDGSISVPPSMLFMADEPVILESLPLTLLRSKSLQNLVWASGEFDISKWMRPCDCTFYLLDESRPAVIYRGDPLFVVRFKPQSGARVKLKRVALTEEMLTAATSCTRAKEWAKHIPLTSLYSVAASFLASLGFGPKKRKCPFNFGEKK